MDHSERRERGAEIWKQVTQTPECEGTDPLHAAVLDFVFAEVWTREALSFRDRRLISLTCAAIAAHPGPIRSHLRSSLLSGDLSEPELRELVL